MTAKRYAKTITGLAQELDIARQNLHSTWIPKDGFPEKTTKGFPVEKCAEFIRNYKQSKAVVVGANADLKRKELEREIELLDVKIGNFRGTLMPLDEHDQEVEEIARTINSALDRWIQRIKTTGKVEAWNWAREERDNCRRYLAGKFNDGGDRNLTTKN